MKTSETAIEKSERYYSRLVAGKSLERKVGVAITEYAANRNATPGAEQMRISLYEPQVDIDAIDLIVRFDTKDWIHLEEMQVKTTRNGLQISESMLRMSDHYKAVGQAFLIVCCREPEALTSIRDTRCFHNHSLDDLLITGSNHIAGSLIDGLPSYDQFIDSIINISSKTGRTIKK